MEGRAFRLRIYRTASWQNRRTTTILFPRIWDRYGFYFPIDLIVRSKPGNRPRGRLGVFREKSEGFQNICHDLMKR